jgi:hypothetical protein
MHRAISTATKPTVPDIYERVESVDLRPVQRKLELKGWTPNYIARVEAEYRRFYALAGGGEAAIAPPSDIDEFWHTHILHTRLYASNCEDVFGFFLHHDPTTIEIVPQADMMKAGANSALVLYRKYFGEPDPYIWGLVGHDCQSSPSECYGGSGGGGGCLGGPTGD